MSGWTDFAGLAKTALFSAQKRIDEVLDIKEAGGSKSGAVQITHTQIKGKKYGNCDPSLVETALLASFHEFAHTVSMSV